MRERLGRGQDRNVLLTAVCALLLPPGRLTDLTDLLPLLPTPGQGSPPHAGPDSLSEAAGPAVVTPEEGGLVPDQQWTVNTERLLLSQSGTFKWQKLYFSIKTDNFISSYH